jgi:protein phosphatase
MSMRRSDWLSKVRSFSGIGVLAKEEMSSIAISLRIGFEDEMHRIFLLSSALNSHSMVSLTNLALNSIRKALASRTEVQLPSEWESDGGIAISLDGVLTYRHFGERPFIPSPYREEVRAVTSPFFQGMFREEYIVLTPSYLVFLRRNMTPEEVLEEWENIPEACISVAGERIEASGLILRGRRAISSISDRGLVRRNNEDSCLSSALEISEGGRRRRYHILCVADGVGGAGYGEIASREAIFGAYIGLINGILEHRSMDYAIKEAIRLANEEVLQEKRRRGEMGTTMTLAAIEGDDVTVGHAGDSRAYIIDGEASQLTRDHKYVEDLIDRGLITREQARFHPQRNIITSALGMENPRVDIKTFPRILTGGKSLLLSTDGLTDLVSDQEISECFARYPHHPDLIGRILISMANARGGHDNVSVSLLTHIG